MIAANRARAGRYWPILMIVAAVGMAVCAFAHRHLYGDGAYFLVMILPTRSFTLWDTSRQYAHFVLEGPLWVALNALRITDVRVLSWIYGLTLFLHPVASLWCCWRILGRRNRALMILPALCWACLTLTTSFFIISESWLGVSLFWPIYFLLLFHHHALGAIEGPFLAACSLAAIRIYEGFALLAALLLAMALRRVYCRCRQGTAVDGWALLSAALLAIAVVADLYWALFPRDPHNRAAGLQGLAALATSPQGAIVVAAVVFFAGPRWGRTRLDRVGVLLLAAGSVVWAIQPWRAMESIQASRHSDLRLINNLMPFTLGLIPFVVARVRRLRFTLGPVRKFAFAVFTVAVLGWQWGASWAWWRYLQRFTEVLNTEQGFVDPRSTDLLRYGFDWGWTYPSMSVVLGAMQRRPLRALVVNPPGVFWEPFDPARAEQLPDFGRYGLEYALPRYDLGKGPGEAR